MNKPALFVLAFLSCSAIVYSQIVLSEIMFNPTGNERYNEFIEIFNSANDAIDLDGWMIGDGDKCSVIIAHKQGLSLAPKQYGLILVPNYFTGNGIYDKTIPASALVVTINSSQFGANGLANDRSETITLYKPDSSIAAFYQYSMPTEDGISDEKRLITGNDDVSNWGHSLAVNGTPGARNSIAPKEYDAALNLESLQISPAKPACGEPITISVIIDNAGTMQLQNINILFTLKSMIDPGLPTVCDSVKIPSLQPFQSLTIHSVLYNIPSGVDSLSIRVEQEQDQELTNNYYAGELLCGYPQQALVINEIMFAPLSGMKEWVELYNPGFSPVTVKNWQISNSSSKPVTVTDSLLIVYPQNFIVIAKDSAIFSILLSEAAVVVCNKFPALGNDADSLFVYDGAGSITEQAAWIAGSEKKKGVSLERINPQNPSHYKNNWNYCLSADGHTAGMVNSVFSKELAAATRLSIFPDPFSPDNDGIDDQTAIHYNLPELTATINIRIFDIKGRQVRFLQNNQPTAANGTVFWDGRDDEGICCRIGIYIVFLEARNSRNEWLDQVYATLVLAKNL